MKDKQTAVIYARVSTNDQSYKNHCIDSGCKPLNKRNFGNRLVAIGSKWKRGTGGTVGYSVTKQIVI